MSDGFTITRMYDGANELRNALNAAKSKDCTRDLMAEFYEDCLVAHALGHSADWATLNAAIVARWPKGLQYIKEKAWKLFRERHGSKAEEQR